MQKTEVGFVKHPILGKGGRFVDKDGNLFEFLGSFEEKELLGKVNKAFFMESFEKLGFSPVKLRA